MPLYIGETINDFAERVLRAPLARTAAMNPIYTALVVTLIVVLVIVVVFRDAETDEPLSVMTIRAGFWTFVPTLGLMFLHNKILTAEYNDAQRNTKYTEVFGKGEPSTPVIAQDSIVPVKINTDFTLL